MAKSTDVQVKYGSRKKVVGRVLYNWGELQKPDQIMTLRPAKGKKLKPSSIRSQASKQAKIRGVQYSVSEGFDEKGQFVVVKLNRYLPS